MTLHQILPFLSVVEVGLIISWATAAGIWMLRLGTRALVWLLVPATRAAKRPGARSFLVLPVCLSLLTGLNAANLPLRIGFWMSEPALNRAASHRSGGNIAVFPPRRFGPYSSKVMTVDSLQNARIQVADSKLLFGGARRFRQVSSRLRRRQILTHARLPTAKIHSTFQRLVLVGRIKR